MLSIIISIRITIRIASWLSKFLQSFTPSFESKCWRQFLLGNKFMMFGRPISQVLPNYWASLMTSNSFIILRKTSVKEIEAKLVRQSK